MTTFTETLIQLATIELGTKEIGASNCGPRVNQYKAATNLPPDQEWPWCAAFVCWLVREALKATGTLETATFRRPTTASAFGLETWSLAQDETTQTSKLPQRDIKPGDIVVYNFSHCGIAFTVCDDTGHFLAIEGNTNGAGSREGGAVLKRTRRTLQVRSRIRFNV